jgi:acyl-[acyl-carrier-protein]-phospholipid O-acyltransferase / long-chain-fatty-acid--[acyl-carrier-protein] ligase
MPQDQMTDSDATARDRAVLPTVGWRAGFWSLIITQFQGAFSDNALKNLVIYLILGMSLPHELRDRMISFVGITFAVPFILFSMTGGYLADRYSKRSVTIGTKYLEIAVMLLALAGLAFSKLSIQFAAIFLICTQAALFGASKYGLLPELLPTEELSWGNGIIELGTFLASITGTMAGAFLSQTFGGRQQWSGFILLAISLLGLATSYTITRVPAAAPAKTYRLNFVADVWAQVGEMRRDRLLALAVIGNTYFWYLGALVLLVVVVYGTDVLGLTQVRTSYLQAALALGIGVGSLVAGYASGPEIEYGLVPLGALGMAAFAAGLALPGLHFLSALTLLALLGFSAGFFAVPVNALIQKRPAKDRRGAVIAAANLISWIGIGFASAAYYAASEWFYLSPRGILAASAVTTLMAAVLIVLLQPDSLQRMWRWMMGTRGVAGAPHE